MPGDARGFAGFLDGYKARNIAVSVSSIEYHMGEIKRLASDLLIEMRVDKNTTREVIQHLERLSTAIAVNKEDAISNGISCGETIKSLLLAFRKQTSSKNDSFDEKAKRIVYHYLEFAELTEDKSIGDIAIAIGELY